MTLFQVPPDARFDCSGCTRCCRGWRIRVDPAAAGAIARTGHAAQLRREGERWFTLKTADDACSLLTSQGACSVHAVKPAGCRLFPFRLVRTPDGVFVGASHVCPAVRRNHGRPWSEHLPELNGFAAELPLVGDEPLPIHGAARISWDAYRLLEARLLEELQSGETGAALWLLAAAPAGVLTAESWSERLAEACRRVEPPADPWAELEHRWACALLAEMEKLPLQALRERRAVSFPLPQGGSWAGRVNALPSMGASARLTSYLQGVLFRKFLVVRRPLLSNLVAFQLAPRVLGWCAALHRLGRGGGSWLPEDLDWAVERCEEKLYAHAPAGAWNDLLEAAAAEFRWVTG